MSFRLTVGYNSRPTRKFEKLDEYGDPVNLTGYIIKLIVKPYRGNDDGMLPDSRAWLNFAGTLISATAGTYKFDLTPAETCLPAGIWPAEIRFWNPPTAPSVACGDALAGAGAGNVDNGLHTYKYTYVSAYGESNGSPVSDGVTVADKTIDGKVALTGVAVGPAGTTARKIYRTVAGGAGDFKLVATISDNVTTTYQDNVADASLGAVIPTSDTSAPPVDRDVGEYEVTEAVDNA